MSENFYFDIKGRSAMPFQVYIGGRGIGKSYSALRELAIGMPENEKWIYMRRTGTEIDACATEFGNPFKTINKDFGTLIVPSSGGKSVAKYFYNQIDEDNPILSGYGVALSTFAGLRSMDLSDVTVVVFDEFIPERQVKRMKAEGDALLNFYETVNRNRELQGRPPLKLILLANAIDLANPILETLGIISELENMISHGEHRRTLPERGLYIERVGKVGVTNAKQHTALYKLANADFTNDTLNAEFLSADLTTIKRNVNLKEYKPVFRFGTYVIFKSAKSFHVQKSDITVAKSFPESAGVKVRTFFAPTYRVARAYGNITFADYTTQVFFDDLFQWET